MALFSTLMICSFNSMKIVSKNKPSKFVPCFIVLLNLILSNFGYAFIVKYLYVISGAISGIYVVVLIIMIIISLIKLKINNRKKID